MTTIGVLRRQRVNTVRKVQIKIVQDVQDVQHNVTTECAVPSSSVRKHSKLMFVAARNDQFPYLRTQQLILSRFPVNHKVRHPRCVHK